MTRRIAIRLAAACLSIVVLLYALGWALSRPVPVEIGPAPASLDAESVTFSSQSGSEIHGWLSRAPTATGAVLLLPGVHANRRSMVRRAEFLRQAGYSTLLIDFQATGESPGGRITFGWLERLDVLAAVQYLKTRMPGQPIGVIGTSLGGAAAVLAAPPLDVQAAVLEAVYPSIDLAVGNRVEKVLGKRGRWLAPVLLSQLRPQLGVSAADLRPVDHIARLNCPILMIGGTIDRNTTLDDTRLLFAAARDPKELWLIPNAAHVDFQRFASDEYRRRIIAFLANALGRARATSGSTDRQDLAKIKIESEHDLIVNASIGQHLTVGSPVHRQSANVFALVLQRVEKSDRLRRDPSISKEPHRLSDTERMHFIARQGAGIRKSLTNILGFQIGQLADERLLRAETTEGPHRAC